MRVSLGNNFRTDIKWVCVEGTIAAGKSTLLRIAQDALEQEYGKGSVLFVQEPVDVWLQTGHLERAGVEPYVAQTFFFHTRVERILGALESLSLEEARKVRFVVTERSIHSDRHVFWHLTCENKLATPLAADTYPGLWRTWERLLPMRKPHLFLYLTVDAETAQQRMRTRMRECEQSTVSTEYQQQLISRHEELFGGSHFEGVPCARLSTAEPYHTDDEARASVSRKLINLFDAL